MIRLISIFSFFLLLTTFLSCKKGKVDSKLYYNQKANELIQQVILDDSCDCLLEITKESSIKSSLADNPTFDVRKNAIQELKLRDSTELDSLEKLSQNFILDSSFLKQRNVSIIKRDSLREKINDIISKTCPSGILCVSKPVFNKHFTTAILYSSRVGTCIGTNPEIYYYEKGKWKRK